MADITVSISGSSASSNPGGGVSIIGGSGGGARRPGGAPTRSSRSATPKVTNTIVPSNRRTMNPALTTKKSLAKESLLPDYEDEDMQVSPRKPLCKRSRLPWTTIVTWLNFLLIIVVLISFTIYWATAPKAHARHITPIMMSGESAQKLNSVSFVMKPDKDSGGKYMTLPVDVDLKDMIHFEVCCAVQNFFFCNVATKNLGVSAYVTNTKTAVVQIIHDDMLGAECKLMWSQ